MSPASTIVIAAIATVLGAVDHGYRVILVRDGVCSSSDEGHEVLLGLYEQRYDVQIEMAQAEVVLRAWQ